MLTCGKICLPCSLLCQCQWYDMRSLYCLHIGILPCIWIQQGDGHLYCLYMVGPSILSQQQWSLTSVWSNLEIKLEFSYQVEVWQHSVAIHCFFLTGHVIRGWLTIISCYRALCHTFYDHMLASFLFRSQISANFQLALAPSSMSSCKCCYSACLAFCEYRTKSWQLSCLRSGQNIKKEQTLRLCLTIKLCYTNM